MRLPPAPRCVWTAQAAALVLAACATHADPLSRALVVARASEEVYTAWYKAEAERVKTAEGLERLTRVERRWGELTMEMKAALGGMVIARERGGVIQEDEWEEARRQVEEFLRTEGVLR